MADSRKQSPTKSNSSSCNGKNKKKEKEGSQKGPSQKGPSPTDQVLHDWTGRQGVSSREKQRKEGIQRIHSAASTIQRAWRNGNRRYRATKQSENDMKQKRLLISLTEWEREIAAVTIQLAWRKFFRRKMLKSLNPNRRQLRMWDPDIVALKQQALIADIYSEQLMVPFWHPTLKAPVRPFWFHLLPSPAAVSYNFALDKYHPFNSWTGMRPHSWTGPVGTSQNLDYTTQSASLLRPERSVNSQFSYNLRKA